MNQLKQKIAHLSSPKSLIDVQKIDKHPENTNTYLLIGILRFGELWNWFFWDDQKVDRRHRIDVIDGYAL